MLETGRECVVCTRKRYLKEFRGDSIQCYDCERESRHQDDMKQMSLSIRMSKGEKVVSLCKCRRLYENTRVGRKGTIRNYSECELCKSVNQAEYGTQVLVGHQRVLRKERPESVLIGNAPRLKNVTSLVNVKGMLTT